MKHIYIRTTSNPFRNGVKVTSETQQVNGDLVTTAYVQPVASPFSVIITALFALSAVIGLLAFFLKS